MSDEPGHAILTSPYVLKLRGIAKAVPGGRLLFHDLDLEVARGELVAIMGESGVGKSTLLNIIAGLEHADSGTVSIKGRMLRESDEVQLTQLRRERFGFVFQAFHILPYLTLRQNVALPLALASADRRAIATKADELLDLVGLGGRGSDYAKDLSGGELQRVAIARALVHDPALILADEPTGNLDPETAGRILALLEQTVRGRSAAALIVTHSPLAAAVADRMLLLTPHGLVPG